ncbi:MAG: hypothetical protein JRD93_20885, partial [Deltaproteobacteria bacterium]|nr:hypothetical protein [Deltaproteobacteria bacterium]
MAKRNKNKQKRKRSKSKKNRTPISGHTRQGSQLKPPFSKLENVQLCNWMNDRLPEMIWAALIIVAVDRDYALVQFRRILDFISKHEQTENLSDITLTGFSKMEEPLREEILSFIIKPPETAYALATLRLFEALPAYDTWDRLLPKVEPNVELLMDAVGATLWHQSQESTDLRWVKLMAKVVTGKIRGIPEKQAKEWCGYPNMGDQRSVRPSIRAAEMIQFPGDTPGTAWTKAFWDEAWENTSCLALTESKDSRPFEVGATRQQVYFVLDKLKLHWKETHSTTAIDAKHDGVFGMAFYALRILAELFSIEIGNSVLGRLGIRTILEVHINLRFLLTKNDKNLWKKWRVYGAGQAKLNALKFDDNIEAPKHIDVESVEKIAGEDMWEEYLTIDLASWSGLDLRRLSEQSGLKDTYDKHYSWTSGYAHGMWGAIRESCYQTCGNPLHRLHRYPERRRLRDTVDDAAQIVD